MRVRDTQPAARSLAVLAPHRTAWLASFIVIVLGAYVVSPLAHAARIPSARSAPSAMTSGVPFNGTAAVGALFTRSGGKLGAHFCTASVVSSPAGNLLITAAHCMQGKSLGPTTGVAFAPGYHNGRFPHGIWVVRAVYVDSAWAQDQNPDDDFAFLIAGRPGTDIQRSTGAETLRIDRPPQMVQVIGYPDATNRPITCTAKARSFGVRQMVFDCDGYTNGTSGGPFLAHVSATTGEGWVIGVIGGYEQGGDTPNVSYSPRFFASVRALYETAISASSISLSG
jgi:V8-like Glu-specific endopeptidase